MNNNSEQWKQGGDCSQCRRNAYCRKSCTEHKGFMHKVIVSHMARSKTGAKLLAAHAILTHYTDDFK